MNKDTRNKNKLKADLEPPHLVASKPENAWPLSNPTAGEIFELISLPFFILDQKSSFIYLNQSARELFSRFTGGETDLIGKSVNTIFSGGLGSSFYEYHQKAIMTGETAVFEEYFPAIKAWLEVHAYPSLEGICVSFQDVSERKRVAEAFCESEARFRTLADSASDAILTIDADGKIVFANKAAEKVFGYQASELLDMPLTILMPEPFQARFQNTFKQYVYSGMKHVKWERVEFPGKHKDGRSIPLELSYSESIQSGKSVFTSILRDVSERRKVEELLRKSEMNFRALFFQNPTPIWVWDFESLKFLEVNEAAIQFYGYTRQEFLNMTVNDIRPSNEEVRRFMDVLEKVKKQQTVTKYGEWSHRLKDGTIAHLEIAAHLMEFQGRKAVVSVMRDVTHKKEEEKILHDSLTVYRLLFDANPQIMVVFDLETWQFLAVNQAAIDEYGYGREEFLSMKLSDIRPPEEVPKLREYVRSHPPAAKNVVEHVGRWLHQRKDGSTFQVEVLSEVVEFFGKKARLALVRKVGQETSANPWSKHAV